jgi:hypothetical protein
MLKTIIQNKNIKNSDLYEYPFTPDTNIKSRLTQSVFNVHVIHAATTTTKTLDRRDDGG